MRTVPPRALPVKGRLTRSLHAVAGSRIAKRCMTILVGVLVVSIATGCSADGHSSIDGLGGPVTIGLITAILACAAVSGIAMALARLVTRALEALARLITGLVQLAVGAVVLGVIAFAVLIATRTT